MKLGGLGSDLGLIPPPLTTLFVHSIGHWMAPLVITKKKGKRNVFFKWVEAVGRHFLWVAGGLAQSDTTAIEGVDSCS